MMVSLLVHICVTRPQWVNRKSLRLIFHVWFISMCVVSSKYITSIDSFMKFSSDIVTQTTNLSIVHELSTFYQVIPWDGQGNKIRLLMALQNCWYDFESAPPVPISHMYGTPTGYFSPLDMPVFISLWQRAGTFNMFSQEFLEMCMVSDNFLPDDSHWKSLVSIESQ